MAQTEHIVLLGDSIFDNAAYTHGEPSVIDHLRAVLPSGWTATLCAADGAVTASIAAQLRSVPASETRLMVSVGGNDALGNIDLLTMRASSGAEVLTAFDTRLTAFEHAYRDALTLVRAMQRPVAVCTIYNGALSGEEARLARVALMTFNDTICRVAFTLGADVIDLRTVCVEPADYANPIEPSGEGGRKIAHAIVRACRAAGERPAARVWAFSSR